MWRNIKRFLSGYWRRIVKGIAAGTLFAIAFVAAHPIIAVTTLPNLPEPLRQHRIFTFSAVAVLGIALFVIAIGPWLFRGIRSWRAGLVNGAAGWCIICTFAFWVLLESRRISLALGAAALLLLGFVVTALRDSSNHHKKNKTAVTDPDLPIAAASQDTLHRASTIDTLVSLLTTEKPPVIASS